MLPGWAAYHCEYRRNVPPTAGLVREQEAGQFWLFSLTSKPRWARNEIGRDWSRAPFQPSVTSMGSK